MNDRLKLLRKTLKLKQDDLGNMIKFSRSHVSSLENGTREFTDRIINDICRELNVNENWFRTGEGEMFVQSETFSLDEKAQKNNLTDLEIDIIQSYMDLNHETRSEIISWIKSNFDKHAETAATLEPVRTPEQIAAEEAEAYRLEVLAELKTQKSSASDGQNEESS